MRQRRAARVTMGVVAGLLLPTIALAQNNEPIYRSWFWAENALTPRAAALGGAYVGLADDASSVVLNPSGLLTLPIPGDLQLDRVERPSRTLETGDKLTREVDVSGSIGVHFSPRWAVGLAIARPKTDEIFMGTRCATDPAACTPEPTPCPSDQSDQRTNPDRYVCTLLDDGTCDLSSLRVGFTTYAFALAHEPTWLVRGLSLGVAVGRQYVKADGISNRHDKTLDCTVMRPMHDNSTDHRVLWTVGALYRRGPFALGASYRPPLRFTFNRALATTGTHIPEAQPGPAPPHYVVTAPARLSLGSSWRHDFLHSLGRFLLTLEADRVNYGQIADHFTAEPADAAFGSEYQWTDVRALYDPTGYRVKSGTEFRVGAEVTFRSLIRSSQKIVRELGLQLRGGFYAPKPGSLRYSSDNVPSERRVFVGLEPGHLWSYGAAVNDSLFRVELTHVAGGYRGAWLLGLSIRYPGFY
jgi:hypothetical protein